LASSAGEIILGAMNQGGQPSVSAGTSAPGKFPFGIAVCIGLIALGTGPVLFSWPPAPSAAFFREFPGWQMLGCGFLVAVIAGAVCLTAWLDPERGPVKAIRYGGFLLLAALLTDLHYYIIDAFYTGWQLEQYSGVLLHQCPPPDQYRFLPHGTLWWLMLGSGNFVFSSLAYRFFFTFLVCQAAYAFARLYLGPRDAVIVVLLYAAFYPLSTRYYCGNLIDPLSHAVMLAALVSCRRRQWWLTFWLLILGTLIKESMLLLVPGYFLLNLEAPRFPDARALRQLALLAAAGLAVFLACRLPFGFHFDFPTLNRTTELMIRANLGLPGSQTWSNVPVFQRYLQPALFVFLWLPFIVWQRKLLPLSLLATALYLAAAFFAVNLCFGWNHESRNFVPVLIFLLVCTLAIINRLIERQPPGKMAADP
jgi:hypothetical protein